MGQYLLSRIILLAFFIGMGFPVSAQLIQISGTVTDQVTHAPLASCSVRAVNVKRGAITDSAGRYSFLAENHIDSIKISMMGFETITRAVIRKTTQEIDFSLRPVSNVLKDVTIYPTGFDPAVHLFHKILAHKVQNNPDRMHSIQYEMYEKMELDANHISSKISQNRLLKPFAFVFDHKDSSHNNDYYIPVFLTETLADYYYCKDPSINQTRYKAKQMYGIKNESMLQYLDDLKQQVNIYENNPVFFKVTFVSPLADNGLAYYKYTIEERKLVNGRKYFRLGFRPLRSGSNTFTGECWIIDKTYAVTGITMQMDKTANINWVSNISLSQEFSPATDSAMVLSKDALTIQFTVLSDKIPGFIGKKTTYYKNITVNQPVIRDSFPAHANNNLVAETLKKDSMYWNTNRFVPLTGNEKWASEIIQVIHNVPAFVTYRKMVSAIGSGYYPVGSIDIGNLYKVYTHNVVEGSRFNIAFRTNQQFSNCFQLKAYAGMGMKRQIVKYGIGGLFILDRTAWETIQVNYQDDYTSLADHPNELNENSIFGSFLRRTPKNKIQLVNTEALSIRYEKYFSTGFSYGIVADKKVLSPAFNVYYAKGKFRPIIIDSPGPDQRQYHVAEAGISVRYAYKEKFVINHFSRKSLGSKFPVIELGYTRGIPVGEGLLKGDFGFNKYTVSVSQFIHMGTWGNVSYMIDGGITDGVLPIVLLNVAKGNETYYYNRYAFNNMNRYEFVSDHFASIMIEHKWGAFPFNRVPVLKKLHWRALTSFRALTGTMTQANKTANKPANTGGGYHFTVPDKIPYVEAGVGIENIFHVIRIDAIWRLTYKDKPGIPGFGIKAAVVLEF